VWIKKATGLGVTEFMLRYMAWLCLNSKLAGSQMCIVTGPRIELAITLIDRMKGLFRSLSEQNGSTVSGKIQQTQPSVSKNILQKPILFDSKETVIELNGVHIEAYPSHHLDAMRGLKDVSFVYMDEADFFPPGQQQDARDVSERYIAKSNPWIVMVSTPNAPEGLFERIEKEPESTCLYHRLFLDYTYGLDKIYTADEIQAAKASPSFEREYDLNTSKPTALRTMTELKATGLVHMDVGDENTPSKITLISEFDWFLTDQFEELKTRKEKTPPKGDTTITTTIPLPLPILLYDHTVTMKINGDPFCGGKNSLRENDGICRKNNTSHREGEESSIATEPQQQQPQMI
jgi:hypothetical protein